MADTIIIKAATDGPGKAYLVVPTLVADQTYYLTMMGAAGSNTEIQYNDNGSFGADSRLTFNPSTGVLTCTEFAGLLTGNVTGDVSGNAGTVTNGIYTTSDATELAAVAVADYDKYLHADAATGALEWKDVPSGGTPGGSDTQVQYNDGGAFGGDAGLTFNPSTGVLTATGFSGPLVGNVTGDCSGSSGSCTGNAATVTNATFTTTFTNQGGAGVMVWPAAGTTLTIPTGGGTLGTAAWAATGDFLAVAGTAADSDKLDGQHGNYYAVAGAAPAAHDQNASTIIIPNGVGSPSFDDMQDFLQETRSAGRISGGVVSAYVAPPTADGKVSITEMEGMIFKTNTLGGVYTFFKKAADTVDLTGLDDNTVYWIYYDFNGGTPRYLATATRSDIHEYDQFAVGRCWRSGNTVEVLATGHSIYDKDRRSHNRMILKYGAMDRVSGATISAHATPLRLQSNVGSWYVANTPYTTPAADTVEVWYQAGPSTWVKSASTTLWSSVFDGGTNKLYETYQDGTSLGTLGSSRYGVYWIFMCPEGELYVVLGTASYNTIGAAQAATVPSSLPPYCVNWARLVGRVICQKTAAAFYSVESAFATSFTLSAAVDHASLANLAYADSGHIGFVSSAQTTPQTVGDTTNRMTKLWAVDITCTNAITGSVTGNAGTVTNATFTTAFTNQGGAGVLAWPAAGATLTVPTGGGTLGSAAFTASGDYATASHTQAVSTISDASTVGQNLVKLTNPSAIAFPRFNANNTVDALSAADFKTAIGAGSGGGGDGAGGLYYQWLNFGGFMGGP